MAATIVSPGAVSPGRHPIYVSYQPMDSLNAVIMQITANLTAGLRSAGLRSAGLRP
jgi:hypothetical protein